MYSQIKTNSRKKNTTFRQVGCRFQVAGFKLQAELYGGRTGLNGGTEPVTTCKLVLPETSLLYVVALTYINIYWLRNDYESSSSLPPVTCNNYGAT